jgi:transcriptional regulator with XRE-family HTH domain
VETSGCKLPCILGANLLAHNPDKILCMKTIGDLVREWREASELSTTQLAARTGGGVKRQNIEQLESGEVKQPRYLPLLAKAMGCTVDDLHALRAPNPLKHGRKPPPGEMRPLIAGEPAYDAGGLSAEEREVLAAMRQARGRKTHPLLEDESVLQLLDDLLGLRDEKKRAEAIFAAADAIKNVRYGITAPQLTSEPGADLPSAPHQRSPEKPRSRNLRPTSARTTK